MPCGIFTSRDARGNDTRRARFSSAPHFYEGHLLDLNRLPIADGSVTFEIANRTNQMVNLNKTARMYLHKKSTT